MDINDLVSSNLTRLRNRARISQDMLADALATQRTKISAYENGAGIDTKKFELICKVLKAEPWEFYVTDHTPVVVDSGEQEILKLYRQADLMGRGGESIRALKIVIGEGIFERGEELGKRKRERIQTKNKTNTKQRTY